MSPEREAALESKIDALTDISKEIRADVKAMGSQVHSLELWRERTEGRLTSGNERMNLIETKLHEEALVCEKRFSKVEADAKEKSTELAETLKSFVSKKDIALIGAGMGIAGGGLSALVLKFLGILGGSH